MANGTVIEVTVDDGPQAAMTGLRALDAEGITPTTFKLREPSLDDVFLSLTGHRTEAEVAENEDEGLSPRQRRRKKRMEQLEAVVPVATGELA
jgi:ABC-2 type transport system ATP-binding protein